LEQGDLLQCVPVTKVTSIRGIDTGEVLEIPSEDYNVIIMSQSCDLVVRDGKCKVDDVILCPIYSKAELGEDPIYKEAKGWDAARKGQHPGFHLLNKCSLEGQAFDYSLVDLRRVFSMNVNFVREFAARQEKRVRLLPPYREHMSQAFARFFMRVGLPVDIPEFR